MNGFFHCDSFRAEPARFPAVSDLVPRVAGHLMEPFSQACLKEQCARTSKSRCPTVCGLPPAALLGSGCLYQQFYGRHYHEKHERLRSLGGF